MPWTFKCPNCERYVQKDYAWEQWRCACGWVGPRPPEDKETKQ